MDGVMKEEDKRGGIQAGSGKVGRGGRRGCWWVCLHTHRTVRSTDNKDENIIVCVCA